MIAHVEGVVSEKFGMSVIVDVHGIGYEILLPLGDFENSTVGESLKLYTYHHIREQSQELFGFSSLAAKKIFELLITVQGVGPKAALSILSLDDNEVVRNAIASSDTAYIATASGVGKKTAERVIVDLADKVGMPTSISPNIPSAPTNRTSDEALEALMALGFNLNDATVALSDVPTDLSTADRVTLALKTK